MSQPNKPKVSGKIIRGIDQCIVKYLLKPPAFVRNRSAPESLAHKERLLVVDELIKAYLPANDKIATKDTFFNTPGEITPTATYLGKTKSQIHITDLVWPSRFLPHWQDHHLSDTLIQLKIDKGATFLEKFFNSKENLTCYARRYRLDTNEPRPTIICLHGYGGGHFSLEKWSFTVNRLIHKFDFLLKVLPHHSFRKERSRRYLPPRFPSADPRFTIEALRQMYYDYQGIKGFLLDEGVQGIGLAGISLGGYCSALIAALDSQHDFVVPIVPVGNLSDIIKKQSRFLGSIEEQEIEKSKIDRLFSCVSPTNYQSTMGNKMTILAGEGDRITGIEQAKILKNHFDASFETFEGGHLFRTGFENIWLETIKKYSA